MIMKKKNEAIYFIFLRFVNVYWMLLKIYLKFDNLNRQDEHSNLLPPSVRFCLGAACHRPIFKMCIVIIRSYQFQCTQMCIFITNPFRLFIPTFFDHTRIQNNNKYPLLLKTGWFIKITQMFSIYKGNLKFKLL